MERMRENAEAGKRSASIVLGIVMALLLIFSLGVVGRSGSTAGRSRAQAQSAAVTSSTSTSLESYESDSVARSVSSAQGSESDSMTPAAPPDHPELQLQLD